MDLSNVEFKKSESGNYCNCCGIEGNDDDTIYEMALGYRNQKMVISICSKHLGELMGKIITTTK